jgi:hypothetical protein
MTCRYWLTHDDGTADSGHYCGRPAVVRYGERHYLCRMHDSKAAQAEAERRGLVRVELEGLTAAP